MNGKKKKWGENNSLREKKIKKGKEKEIHTHFHVCIPEEYYLSIDANA